MESLDEEALLCKVKGDPSHLVMFLMIMVRPGSIWKIGCEVEEYKMFIALNFLGLVLGNKEVAKVKIN